MISRLLSFTTQKNKNIDEPDARSGHKAINVGPYIIIYGGYNNKDDHIVYNELWFYHVFFKTWKKIKVPEEYSKTALSSAISFYNGKIYIFGGTGYPFSQELTNYILTYEIVTKKWNIIGELNDINRDGLIPSSKYSHSMTFYNKKLYIYGGTTGYDSNDEFNIFDIEKNQWIYPDPPLSGIKLPKCYRHESFVYNNILYIISGSNIFDNVESSFEKLLSMDLKTNEWKIINLFKDLNLNKFPLERTCFGSTNLLNYYFICGGRNEENHVFDDLWKLNLDTLQWTKMNIKLNIPLYFHTLTAGFDGKLYVFGGVTDDFQTRNNNLQSFNVQPQTLMNITVSKIANTKFFENFVNQHTLTSYRLMNKFEMCFQKLP